MARDEVRGDPVQPRAGAGIRDVVAPPPVEGDEERLRRDVLREARPEPSRDVPVDLGVVAIEELRVRSGSRRERSMSAASATTTGISGSVCATARIAAAVLGLVSPSPFDAGTFAD
jgi:hypothetical protein